MDQGKLVEDLGATLRGGSETVYDFYCEECKEEGTDVEGEGYCLDCQEYLCLDCLAVHKKTKLTRQHKLLDKQSMTKDQLQLNCKVKDTCTEICSEHKAEVIKYYCEEHREFGCSVCATIKHRHCKGLEYIPQLAEELEASDEYQQVKGDLHQLSQGFQCTTQEANSKLFQAEKQSDEAVKAVQKLRNEVDKLMETLENDVRQQVEQIKTHDVDQLTSVVAQSKPKLQAVLGVLDEFDSLQESKKFCQLFVAMKERKLQLESLQTSLKEIESLNSSIRTYEFTPTAEFKHAIATPAAIGSISVTESSKAMEVSVPQEPNAVTDRHNTDIDEDDDLTKQESQESVYSIGVGKTGDQTETPPNRSPSDVCATYLSDIKVRTESDTSVCYISGCVLLTLSDLVLSDFSNSKIKVFDSEIFTMKNEFKLISPPWEVVDMGDNRIATTVPNKNRIVLFQLTEYLTNEREIPVNGNCRGLCRYKDKFIVTFTSPPKIEVIDFQGVVIRTLLSESKAASIMSLPYHVAINHEQEIIYVSDCSKNEIVGLAIAGDVNAVCEDVKYPRGMYVDSHGFVFVCARDFHLMYVVTPECRNAKTVLTRTEGLHYPMSACCETGTQKLYVGMEDDFMKIYQLS